MFSEIKLNSSSSSKVNICCRRRRQRYYSSLKRDFRFQGARSIKGSVQCSCAWHMVHFAKRRIWERALRYKSKQTPMQGKWQGKRNSTLYYFSVSIAMSNISLFACGSIHQGHERFSDVSRRKQSAFMSLSALLSGRVFPVQQWTSKTVDRRQNVPKCTYRWRYCRCRVAVMNDLPTIAC